MVADSFVASVFVKLRFVPTVFPSTVS